MATLAFLASLSTAVSAGNVLFVNYNGSDSGIPLALAPDGHDITIVDVPPANANEFFLNQDLDPYCAVVWSTAYAYDDDLVDARNTLSSWISSGGHLLVTAPDGIRNDGDLVSLLGGAGATDSGNGYGTVANVANSVTTGVVDIRGLQPPELSDEDSLCGPLQADTVGIVSALNTGCASEPGYVWTLRNLGAGQVAYIASGNFTGTTTDDPDWTSTAIPGAGVYNAGLRNFVQSACSAASEPRAVPALSPVHLLLLSLLVVGLAGWVKRRGLFDQR
jgi:hypothetical protein